MYVFFLNKWIRIPLQFPDARRTWILCRIAFDISILSFDRIQFPGGKTQNQRVAAAAANAPS